MLKKNCRKTWRQKLKAQRATSWQLSTRNNNIAKITKIPNEWINTYKVFKDDNNSCISQMTVNNSLLLHDSKASLYGSGSKMLTFNRKIPVELGIILVSKSTHENAMICHQQFIFTRCNEPIWFTSYIGNTTWVFALIQESPHIYIPWLRTRTAVVFG